jgi:hypothetical protein
MTIEQGHVFRRLQSRIKQKLEIDEYDGEVYTENQGVSIKIGRNAGIEVPALRRVANFSGEVSF